MSIENTTIHYIKDTMLGDFYLNNPLENKPLGRIFCQMVEFKSLENITYLSPTSVFMQDMLEAFEEFDKLSLLDIQMAVLSLNNLQHLLKNVQIKV